VRTGAACSESNIYINTAEINRCSLTACGSMVHHQPCYYEQYKQQRVSVSTTASDLSAWALMQAVARD